MKKIIKKLLDAKIMGASKLEIQRLQQQLDTQKSEELKDYYVLWDRMTNKPPETLLSDNVSMIHYTTLIGMFNDGFEVNVGREEFRPLSSIPEEYRKSIIDAYK